MMTSEEWLSVLTACGVRRETAERWAPFFAAEIQDHTFSAGWSEVDDFLSNVLHESHMLERVEENLNYTTAARICEIWPSRFRTVDDAKMFVRNPEALANKVYAGRLGNSSIGDGWRYRGSGPIQVTGKANFAALERITGLPLVANPFLLRRVGREALRVCVAWWEGNVPDSIMGNVKKVRRAVNGGEIGLSEVAAIQKRASAALSAFSG